MRLWDEEQTAFSSWRRCIVVWVLGLSLVVGLGALWAGSVEPDAGVTPIMQTQRE